MKTAAPHATSDLPIKAVLPELLGKLETHNRLILVAEPGAGKTTLVPLSLLTLPFLKGQKIIVLEPRRLAARAAARRMAYTLGENVGERVGYRVRMESKVSKRTQIEVVTEGVFVRMIQDDPELNGIGIVLFDEFHERSLDSDLSLALALDCQEALREDLRLVPMSATLDHEGLTSILGHVPLVQSSGRQFPVETIYLGRNAAQPLEKEVANAVKVALAEQQGSVLVFLPGQREIMAVQKNLSGRVAEHIDITPLYGALDSKQQDKAIRPPATGRRKVVLTTSIAQTSLTIEGVRVVVDCGLARVPKYDPQSGLTRLETTKVSRASADQRRGRAGRTEPGVCYRLWEQAQTNAFPKHDRAEILESELSSFALSLASWGVQDPQALKFISPPPPYAWQEAIDLLKLLDALDEKGHITKQGGRLAKLPLQPRLAHMLVQAGEEKNAPLAAHIAAILSEPGLGGKSTDLRQRLRMFISGKSPRDMDMKRQSSRWCKMVGGSNDGPMNFEEAADILSLAYPDRIAQQRGANGRFRLSNGRGAKLSEDDALARTAFISVAEVQGTAANSRIYLCAPYDRQDLENRYAKQLVERKQIGLNESGVVAAHIQTCLGKLVIDERKMTQISDEDLSHALLDFLKKRGSARLPWSKEQLLLRARLGYLRQELGPEWPDVSDTALDRDFSWLAPFVGGLSKLEQVNTQILGDALAMMVPFDLKKQMDSAAPSHFVVPTGSRIAIDYGAELGPTLRVRVQELFGLSQHPSICNGQVQLMLELLSPAQRAIQITGDLPGFWAGSWRDVKADMRGQYPKHYWPDNPLEAEATRRAKQRK
ncbi:ATP-dependent helicase HrpB [Polycladidibacter stylochi]|uniref:ATP-dependent helicase HrpB n=1 Tax=Polycladidibacter stylochi TaxID=1807766 RepID=UPI0008318D32|nr:ATP-dependent helicase HrpB [Pseudovibrio stylochi]